MFNLLKKISTLLLGKEMEIVDAEVQGEGFAIHAKSTARAAACPSCHQMSHVLAGTYGRTLQDIPLHFKGCFASVRVHKFKCENEGCPKKYFAEPLSFARRYQRRTDELNVFMVGLSVSESHEGTTRTLRNFGVLTSDSSVGRLWDKIKIPEEGDVFKFIGVDDVALLKNEEYATAIYDMETHRLIALLPGRDGTALREWLLSHPGVAAVARDRDSAYARAIEDACPGAVQIADRFHLLQNLSDHLWEAMKEQVPENFIFEDGKETAKNIQKVQVLRVPLDSDRLTDLREYDNAPPLDMGGAEVKYDDKRRNPESRQYKRHAEGRKKKQRSIAQMQGEAKKLGQAGKETKEIQGLLSERYGLNPVTVKKYLGMDQQQIDALDAPTAYKKRKTAIDGFQHMVYKMLLDGVAPELIFSYVLKSGYSGSWDSLSAYISHFSMNNFGRRVNRYPGTKLAYPEGVTVISRSDFRCFVTGKKGSRGLEPLFLEASKKCSQLLEMEEVYKDFRRILMGNQRNELDGFIERNGEGIVSGFASHMKKDIEPIKNAISFRENSGFVEGGNHKFKLIKRLGYGRQKLGNLFKKCWLAFQANDEGFSLSKFLLAA